MPYLPAVCGVSPNWAKTGTPARTSARTTSGKSAAASTLIMSAPPSFIRRDAAAAAPHRLAADQHLVERDFEHFVAAPKIDAARIADRDEIDAGAVGDARDLIIPGDDADAFLAVALHLLKRGNGHLVRHYSVRPVRSCMTYIKD